MTVSQSLRAAGRPAVVLAPRACGDLPGGPETPLSPADMLGEVIRRRGLTVDDVIASALAATTRAELSLSMRAYFAIAEPGWSTADIGPLVRCRWPRRFLRAPGPITITRLFSALTRALPRTP